MSEISKTTADKLVYSRSVEQALATHGDDIAEKLERWLFKDEPPKKLSMRELFQKLEDRLAADGTAFAQRDLMHQAELGDDVEPRERRDASVVALKAALIGASDLVRGAFGAAYSRSVGLEMPLAERPDLLVKQARTIAISMTKNPPRTAPRPSARGIDLAAEVRELEQAAGATEEALGDVKREEREAQRSLLLRDEADATWGGSYAFGGKVFAEACRVVGETALADRIEPSPRRRAGVPETPADPGGDVEPTGL